MSIAIRRLAPIAVLIAALGATSATRADSVSDWADATTEIATDGPNTMRTLALAQSAVYEAVNAITGRFQRDRIDLGPSQGASIDAAIAAASRAVLNHEAPVLKERTESAYLSALSRLVLDDARSRGIALGERAAADVLARHTDDIGTIEPYRPLTTPGIYVPTTFPLGYAVAQHHPWFLKSGSQFRPRPPPDLKSALWARDYNEIKAIGSLTSTVRTPEQTDIARFWATALPDVHIGVVRSVAMSAGREVTRNARLFAMVTGALNDAEIAVFDAKYQYQFWRPITAIRNGDRDGNDATERDAAWQPMIVTPVQPEYPCAHCIIAATVATLIRLDVGTDPMPTLSSTSNTAPGVTRRWSRPEEVEKEVAEARILDGVHYRNSTEVGSKMGEQIAAVVAAAYGVTH